jgi:hypothetical protein
MVIDPLLETLQGGWERLETRLRAEMSAAAEALEFEAAAVLRDRLKALEGLRTKKAAPPVSGPERDVIGFVRLADEVAIALLPVRWGRQQPSRTFAFEGQVDGDQSLLTAFLLQLYLEGLDVPPVLQLPFPLEDALLIEQILQEQLGRTITLTWEPDAAGLDAVALLAARTELEGLRDEASRHQRGLDALTRHLRQTAPVTTLTWLGIDAPQQLLWGVRLAPDAVTTQVVRVSLRRQPQQQPLPALKGLLERLGPEPGEFLLVEGGRLMLRTLQEAALPQPLLLAALDPPETARTDDPLAIPRLFLPGRRNALLIPRSSPARRTLEHLRQLGWKKAGLSLPCPSTSNPTPPQPTLQNAVAADVLPGQDGEHSGDEDNPWQS